MESELLLSIIVVAYKSAGEIPGCLDSLPSEIDGRAVETIVVDNSVGTAGAVEDVVKARRPRVTYLAPPGNVGFGRANNLGFRASRGECVLFLNPDTISAPGAIEHCVRRIMDDRSIGVISPRLVTADGSMDLACRRSIPGLWDGFCRGSGLAGIFPKVRFFAGYNLTYLPAAGTYDVGAVNGAFMLGRRAVFEAISDPNGTVFDEAFFMYGDDLDLCIRIGRSGLRIVYDGTVQITHLKGTSVAKDYDRMARAIFDANRDVFLKHFNPRRSVLVRWKFQIAFGLWKHVALARAHLRGYRRVRPV